MRAAASAAVAAAAGLCYYRWAHGPSEATDDAFAHCTHLRKHSALAELFRDLAKLNNATAVALVPRVDRFLSGVAEQNSTSRLMHLHRDAASILHDVRESLASCKHRIAPELFPLLVQTLEEGVPKLEAVLENALHNAMLNDEWAL